MEKLFYSIGEASDTINESVSLVRFWANSFPNLFKLKRTAKGNRLFTADDIETLKQLHLLIKTKGMTLDGAAAQLKGNKDKVDKSVKALESLKNIRAQLVEIKNSL